MGLVCFRYQRAWRTWVWHAIWALVVTGFTSAFRRGSAPPTLCALVDLGIGRVERMAVSGVLYVECSLTLEFGLQQAYVGTGLACG